MLFQEFLHKDIRRVSEELGTIREQVLGSFELNTLTNNIEGRNQLLYRQATDFKATAVEQINRALESLNKLEEECRDSDSPNMARYGIFFLVSLQSLENDVIDFQTQMVAAQAQAPLSTSTTKSPAPVQQGNPVKLVVSWLKNNLIPRLKQVLRKAWQIASNLLTPTKWVIRGDASTGIFGLANVGLEITFESESVKVPFSGAAVSVSN